MGHATSVCSKWEINRAGLACLGVRCRCAPMHEQADPVVPGRSSRCPIYFYFLSSPVDSNGRLTVQTSAHDALLCSLAGTFLPTASMDGQQFPGTTRLPQPATASRCFGTALPSFAVQCTMWAHPPQWQWWRPAWRTPPCRPAQWRPPTLGRAAQSEQCLRGPRTRSASLGEAVHAQSLAADLMLAPLQPTKHPSPSSCMYVGSQHRMVAQRPRAATCLLERLQARLTCVLRHSLFLKHMGRVAPMAVARKQPVMPDVLPT